VIDTLVNELNDKFLTEIGPVDNPVKMGPSEQPITGTKVKFIFVGSSHAARLAGAAEKLNLRSSLVTLPGSRITAAAVEAATQQLQEELSNADEGRVVVVYHIFDNNAFFSAGEDGSKALPSKGDGDRHFHVPGRLEVADHGVVKALVNASAALLRSGGEMEKLILSPLPRYIVPCCGDDAHIVNRNEADYQSTIIEGVAEFKRSLKDLVFGKKNYKF
jgi:hypothetical protein